MFRNIYINVEPSQGPNNDFHKCAWPQLEQQDKLNPLEVIDWKNISRIEKDLQGKRLLSYLKSDPVTPQAYVDCHNKYEKTNIVMNIRNENGIKVNK